MCVVLRGGEGGEEIGGGVERISVIHKTSRSHQIKLVHSSST